MTGRDDPSGAGALAHDRRLHVVMYHYVRDLAASKFPRIRGMEVGDFRRQLKGLAERWELVGLEAALAFLRGRYTPARDLCLLTFDDGLADHYRNVVPILQEYGIQGVFFLVTGCIEEGRVADVHKNHFLVDTLPAVVYRREVLWLARDLDSHVALGVDPAGAQRMYRWDTPEDAQLKYLLNFQLSEPVRTRLLDTLFARHLGPEATFARELYVSWQQARAMRAEGMALGGHPHSHGALGGLPAERHRAELRTCVALLAARLGESTGYPFSYPYGKPGSFDELTIRLVSEAGFGCGFTTVGGSNGPTEDLFTLRRLDPKDCGASTA